MCPVLSVGRFSRLAPFMGSNNQEWAGSSGLSHTHTCSFPCTGQNPTCLAEGSPRTLPSADTSLIKACLAGVKGLVVATLDSPGTLSLPVPRPAPGARSLCFIHFSQGPQEGGRDRPFPSREDGDLGKLRNEPKVTRSARGEAGAWTRAAKLRTGVLSAAATAHYPSLKSLQGSKAVTRQ